MTIRIDVFVLYVLESIAADTATGASQANREEVDARSVFVGNVRLLYHEFTVVIFVSHPSLICIKNNSAAFQVSTKFAVLPAQVAL